MKFEFDVALFLDNELKKLGVYREEAITSDNFVIFNSEDLQKITKLTITGLENIDFLKFLPNLKKLRLLSKDYSLVMEDGSYFNNPLFNDISSYSVIENLTQLEELEIINDINIRELDFKRLTNLKKIKLFNNPNLSRLINMGNMHYLKSVVMYGNPIKEFQNFEEYLANTLDAETNIVDVDAYLANVKSVSDANKLYEKSISGQINVQFAEKSGLFHYTTTYLSNLTELYIKLYRKLVRSKIFDKPVTDRIEYVYEYGLKIKFAEKELKERQDLYDEILNKYNEIPDFYRKRLSFLHNSYSTFHFNYGNCEGIVNLMHIMLSMLGIESENVHCHDRRYNYSIVNNHALLRIKTDGEWFYYDAVYNRNIRIYGQTYEQITDYFDMSKFEKQKVDEKHNGQYNGTNTRKHR